MKILPSDNSYANFCELTTGYRMFLVLQEAVRSGIIDLLEPGALSAAQLMTAAGLQPAEGGRFVALLVSLGLLEEYAGLLYLSRFSRDYLTSDSRVSQRQVLEFEPLLMENWLRMGELLRHGQGTLIREKSADEYRQRLALFQGAMAEAAGVRADELWQALAGLPETGLIIDIGAGDGSYLRAFLKHHPCWQAMACDLPDVCQQAQMQPDNHGIYWHPLNILDRVELETLVREHQGAASLLLFSNLLHCYQAEENRGMLAKAAELVAAGGMVVVHDFFRDGNSFGALYDLHMLVNTLSGRSYSFAETAGLLESAGFGQQTILGLPSLSHAMVATRHTPYQAEAATRQTLARKALEIGFFAAVPLDPATISCEPWVKAKCAYGCSQYGRKWSCPPHAMPPEEFRAILGGYSHALLLAGQPPLRDFQENLLELEKQAFLAGCKKALAFSGGPCCWCETCPDDRCAFPDKRRPSLEACGCDVFSLAESTGLTVAPLRNSDDFVQFIGLLLLE